MSCQRAQQIDLAAFLAEPRDAAFGDFREHYPACPACSAAVAEGTRLERALRALGDAGRDHPDPDLLARWQADRTALDANARARISQHLAGCTPCREELRALRDFDPVALRAPAAPERPQRAAPDPVPWWRTLLGSPASALAMAGVVLAPFVYVAINLGERLGLGSFDAPLERGLALEEPSPPRFAAKSGESLGRLSSLAEVPAAAPPSRSPGHEQDLGEVSALDEIASPKGDAVERSTASALASARPPAGASVASMVRARAPTPAFSLGGETLRIDAAGFQRGSELRVPIPERWRGLPELALHFSDGRGRERREVLRLETGAPIARVVIDPGWLRPGTWQVLLVPPHGDPERFAIEVR